MVVRYLALRLGALTARGRLMPDPAGPTRPGDACLPQREPSEPVKTGWLGEQKADAGTWPILRDFPSSQKAGFEAD
jgi:hypothetical protein